jgi:hypothetical protein
METCFLDYVLRYNKIFSGYQPCQLVKRPINQRFKDYLCPHPQGADVSGEPVRVTYIPAQVPCSWLCTSQWELLVFVKSLLRQTDFLNGQHVYHRMPSMAQHEAIVCWSFCCSVGYQWLPSHDGPYSLMSCPKQWCCCSRCNALYWYCVPPPHSSDCSRQMCLLCSLHLVMMDLSVWPTYTLPHSHWIQYTPGTFKLQSSLTQAYAWSSSVEYEPSLCWIWLEAY